MKNTIHHHLTRYARPLLIATALVGTALTANAAAYIKIGDIKGEATDNEHKDWIIIESMSQAVRKPVQLDTSTGQRTRGDTVLGDVVCVKELDKSSPKIAEAVCNGAHFPEVTIELCKSVPSNDGTGGTKQVPYLTYKLKDVIVTSYNISGGTADGDPLPTEEIALGYTEVEWTYIVLDPAGNPTETVQGVWSVATPTS